MNIAPIKNSSKAFSSKNVTVSTNGRAKSTGKLGSVISSKMSVVSGVTVNSKVSQVR